jgi:hypothetical protein
MAVPAACTTTNVDTTGTGGSATSSGGGTTSQGGSTSQGGGSGVGGSGGAGACIACADWATACANDDPECDADLICGEADQTGSYAIFEDLADCSCNACADVCGTADGCPDSGSGGAGGGSGGAGGSGGSGYVDCASCIDAETNANGACYTEYTACESDV